MSIPAARTDYVIFSVFCQPPNQAFSKFFEKALFVASDVEVMR